MRWKSLPVLAGVGVAVTAGGGAFAIGAIPPADGRIHGCYHQTNGNLRIVDEGESCKGGERAISWNEKGPKGDSGPQGLRGEAGPAGPQGERGADGAQGPQGERGADGAQGPQGERGADGAQGPQGERGADGAQGPQGERGADGAAGPKGDKGDPGQQGPAGPIGPPGPPGSGVAVEEKRPAAYPGSFVLLIGAARVPLTSFAGCSIKSLPTSTALGEYRDCYFTAPSIAAGLQNWLEAALQGGTELRNLQVLQIANGQIVSGLEIDDGFLSEFAYSETNATDSGLAEFDFTVTPRRVRRLAGGGPFSGAGGTPVLRKANFRWEIPGVARQGVTGSEAIRITWPKVPFDGGLETGYREYRPGTPAYQPFRLTAAAAGNFDTRRDLEDWVEDVEEGTSGSHRDGRLLLLDPQLQDVELEVFLPRLIPITGVDPFGTHVGVTLRPEPHGSSG